jgi:hypothetical protein
VRELLAGEPETAETAELELAACMQVLNLGWRVGLPEEEISSTHDDGRALAERTGDVAAHLRLLATSSAARGTAGDVRGALAQVFEAAPLAEGTGNRALEVLPFVGGAVWRYFLGDLRAALADAEQLIDLTRDDPGSGWRSLASVSAPSRGRFAP